MAGPPNAENIAASGPRGTVEYAVRDNGHAEVKEWLAEQPNTIRASFGLLFERVVLQGLPFPNREQLKKLQGMDDVWEFRRGGNRIFCVLHTRRWLLTHPYKKGKSKNHQTASAKHAIAIAEEHLEREREELRRKEKRDRKR